MTKFVAQFIGGPHDGRTMDTSNPAPEIYFPISPKCNEFFVSAGLELPPHPKPDRHVYRLQAEECGVLKYRYIGVH